MDNNLALKRVFSKTVFHDLLSGKQNDTFDYVVKRYVSDPCGKNYSELVSEIYAYMGRCYRTEYYYKNTMLNKLLFKKHDYRKTTVLTELPIADSKADFVMINGKGVVYEIKTELDNLDRLESQLKDYYKAFTEVSIVTYEDNINKLIDKFPSTVGLIALTNRKALKTIREPLSDCSFLSYSTIFGILRKYEFENIIIDSGYTLPTENQFKYYSECFNLITKIDLLILQKEMLKELKKRMKIEVTEFSLSMPDELRFLTYSDKSSLKYSKNALCELQKCYGG